MHELGVLHQVVKTVGRIAEENQIRKIKHITLEVGNVSFPWRWMAAPH